MSVNKAGLIKRRWGQTLRRDNWWVEPLLVFLVLSSFLVYATWAAFQNEHFQHKNYLSPFYSPVAWGDSHHAWFGTEPPGFWPSWLVFSPALLILPFPAGFRLTCYYYRGAYYKAFWSDPPACTVGEPRNEYLGERYLPLVLQNLHRYFLFFALIFLCFLSYDAVAAFFFDDNNDGIYSNFGIGVGTLVLLMNVFLLAGYTLGCHSLRHLVGGWMDRFSQAPVRSACYNCVNKFNGKHHLWAWFSLFWVAFSDIYVRLCSMGIWTDYHITFF
jgi:hypothetical protein